VRRPRSRLPVLLLLLLALGPAVAAGNDDAAPLRDEDVVRMVVAGRANEEILREIRDRPVAFDLSDEMLDELRVAGVPAELIRAMQQRQSEMTDQDDQQTPAPPADVAIEPERARLTVRLEPPDEAEPPPALVFPLGPLPEALAEQHGLGPAPAEREVTDLALFLACRTAVHVPDHWRAQSPMGRDFVRMPRHRILAFHAGAQRVEGRRAGGGRLRLELPAELTADVEPGESHDLVLGIAGKVGDRWLALDLAERDDVEVPSGGASLRASAWSRIEGRRAVSGVAFSD